MNDAIFWTGAAMWLFAAALALMLLALLASDIVTDLGRAFGTAFRLARLGSDKGRKS